MKAVLRINLTWHGRSGFSFLWRENSQEAAALLPTLRKKKYKIVFKKRDSGEISKVERMTKLDSNWKEAGMIHLQRCQSK